MEKKPITPHLFVSDLDGTLLNDTAKLTPTSAQKLNRILENGIQFTVASARSWVSMKAMLKGVNIKLPVIQLNGAYISDYETGKHLKIQSFPNVKSRKIWEIIKNHGCTSFISTHHHHQDFLYYNKATNKGFEWLVNERVTFEDERLRQIEDLDTIIDQETVNFTVIDQKNVIDDLYKKLNHHLPNELEMHKMINHYQEGNWWWLNVLDKTASKGNALRTLCAHLGVNIENTTVFGDSVNDIKMLEVAGNGIAVGNALPEVKSVANNIINTNEEESVPNFIINKCFNLEM